MTLAASALGPSAYWYLTRATGAVALVLLTASVVLGILGSLRFSLAPRWPRFAVDSLHRDVSLLVIVFVVIHVVTSVLDGFAPISLLDGLIPFRSPYRPLWLGLGTLSFDLLIALAVTSLVRRRLGYSAWRAIHWLAYASWPIAVLHGLGTGTDVKTWWSLLLTIACVAAVVAAALARVVRTDPVPEGLRTGATILAVATPLGLATFALAGPLQPGWSRRAGTPAKLLGFHRAAGRVGRAGHSVPVAKRPPAGAGPLTLNHRFSDTLSGKVTQEQQPGGAIVQLSLQMAGPVSGQLRVRMGGVPIDGGGLSLTGSQVDLSAAGLPAALAGRIVSLNGDRFEARVSGAGVSVDLHANLNIDSSNDSVTGSLSGAPNGSAR